MPTQTPTSTYTCSKIRRQLLFSGEGRFVQRVLKFHGRKLAHLGVFDLIVRSRCFPLVFDVRLLNRTGPPRVTAVPEASAPPALPPRSPAAPFLQRSAGLPSYRRGRTGRTAPEAGSSYLYGRPRLGPRSQGRAGGGRRQLFGPEHPRGIGDIAVQVRVVVVLLLWDNFGSYDQRVPSVAEIRDGGEYHGLRQEGFCEIKVREPLCAPGVSQRFDGSATTIPPPLYDSNCRPNSITTQAVVILLFTPLSNT